MAHATELITSSQRERLAWYRTVTREQWNALLAAQLGWMLDAMDFVLYLMAITTLQKEFGFGTDMAGWLASVALITSSIGGLLFGVVADYVGRTRALMATILIYSLCSLGTATAQSVNQLILWRAALGFGMGGEWSSGAVLVSETWSAEHRGKAIGIMQSGWAIGYILAALAARVILPAFGWRWLFAVGVLPALVVFWIRRSVREPEVWSARKSALAARKNPLQHGPSEQENDAQPDSRRQEEASEAPGLPKHTPTNIENQSSIVAIFKRELIARTLKASLLTTAVMFAYWGLFTWLPAFLATPIEQGGAGMTLVRSTSWIIPMQIGAFFGYLSFGFVSDSLGRRRAFVLYLVGAAALVPVYGSMARSPELLMVVGPFLGFFGHGYFSVFGAMLAELFPTSVRATGQGFTYNVGRGLSAFAPVTIGVLAKTHGLGAALAITSAFFIAGALMVLLIPETRGRKFD